MSVELWISLLSAIIAIGAVVISLYFSGRKTKTYPTSERIRTSLQTIPSLAKEFESVGLMAVTSAEQLASKGEINTADEKFVEAFNYVDNWSKNILGIDLDPIMVKKIVEGSYKIFKETIRTKKLDNVLEDIVLNRVEKDSLHEQ